MFQWVRGDSNSTADYSISIELYVTEKFDNGLLHQWGSGPLLPNVKLFTVLMSGALCLEETPVSRMIRRILATLARHPL